MAPIAHASFFPFLLLISSTVASNIVGILQPFTQYSTFTKYLTETKVADEINRRQTITVLALDNNAISPLASLSASALKNAISVHIILDYYDPYKLHNIPNKTTLLTTLFQASGLATNNMGFLNYTEMSNERMVLGSAAPGSPLNANVNKVVTARPYNISVLDISTPIVPQGIASATPAPPTPAATVPTAAPGKKESPAIPTAAPEASPPAHTAKAPVGSAAAPAPAADADVTASPAKSEAAADAMDEHSSAARTAVSVTIGLAMGTVALAAL